MTGEDAQPLSGQTVLVTGGGRGIGRAIALAAANAGADVCVTARSAEQVEAAAAEINALSRKGIAEVCDVTDFDSVSSMIESAVSQLGKLDILVNNAGGGLERTPVGKDNPAVWKDVIEVNLLGTYYCSRQALPHLKKSRGKIINVGSGMGHQARATNSSYNAAKAGVWMLTRCMAMQLWDEGVAVNELIPGPVATELTKDAFQAGVPHPQMGSEWIKQPEDVVPLAMLMMTQPEKGATGQCFSIARRPL